MKKRIIAVVLIIAIIQSFGMCVFANTIDELKQQKKETEEKHTDIKEELSIELDAICELDAEISEYEKEIGQLEGKIEELNASIKNSEIEIENLQKEHAEKEKLLEDRLVAIYMAGNTTYLDVLLSSEDITSLISNYYMVQQLAEADNKLLETIEEQENKIQSTKQKMENEKKEIDTAKREIEDKNNELKSKRATRQEKADNLSAEEKSLKDKIEEYQNSIDKMEEELAKAFENSNYESTYSGGQMEWPIPGEYYITSYVGWRWGRMHKGIDIGADEYTPVIAAEDDKYQRLGSIGKAFPSIDVKIENPNEEGVGELLAKGPSIMLGYYNNEEATKETLEDGWLHTGDLAKIDKDGYIFISGRKKFVIVLKNGKNIYPEELETLVNKIEGIKESFVYGKPEDDGDYKICCKIVYDKDNVKEIYGTDEEEKLKELIWQEVKKVNKTMPAYKYIREITLTDKELIKTTTQKIKRFEEMKNVI